MNNQALIKYIGLTVFICATWSLLAGAINLANDTSPTLAEKIINIPAAAAISLGGGMMFYYSKQTHLLESLFIMSFGVTTQPQPSSMQSTGNFKTRLKNGLNAVKSSFNKQGSDSTVTAQRSEPSISFLRTGTDNEPFEIETESKPIKSL